MNENSFAFTLEEGRGALPQPVEDFAGRSQRETPALLVVAGTAAARSGWSTRATIALAEALARRHRRIVLGDLALERPELHQLLGGGNHEGMADIFLYGASLRRVARPAGDGSFYFVPAGPYAPDPAEVMRHPRWDRFLEGLIESGATLLAYVPADAPGLDVLTEHVPYVVVLAEPGEAAAVAAMLSPGCEPVVTLTPAGELAGWPAPVAGADRDEPAIAGDDALDADGHFDAVDADSPFDAPGAGSPVDALDAEALLDASRADSTDSPDADGLVDALVADADGWRRQDERRPEDERYGEEDRTEEPEADAHRVAAGSPASSGDPAADRLLHAREQGRAEPDAPFFEPASPPDDEELLDEPVFVARAARKSRRGRAVLLVLVVGLLVAGGWFAWNRLAANPAADAAPTEAPQAAEPEAVTVDPGLGDSLEEPLGFSVAIEAHQDLDLAHERVRLLSASEPDLLFYLAPIAVDGVVYYRVLAGPTSESAAAERLMRRLVDAGHKTQVQAWDVRPTAWAYELGEFDAESEAEARRDEVREAGVSSYIVEVPHTRASRYRLYAGAYSGPAEAEIMGELLRDAGIEASFRRRAGRPAL